MRVISRPKTFKRQLAPDETLRDDDNVATRQTVIILTPFEHSTTLFQVVATKICPFGDRVFTVEAPHAIDVHLKTHYEVSAEE